MRKKYNTLLNEYDALIESIYEVSRFSGDYTPDYMRYDLNGYADEITTDEEIKQYLPHLIEAVKNAKLYYKALTNKYNYIFG